MFLNIKKHVNENPKPSVNIQIPIAPLPWGSVRLFYFEKSVKHPESWHQKESISRHKTKEIGSQVRQSLIAVKIV